ncbi:hypothetical protein AVEN_68419-1 [Araneus ventricosus]|uniref:Uncharacterized protein n=1 Tax=Araneus ventricosus TaxID=182803 RepID=A0A4Y2SLF1_ARAVE|nr:hypothetical protein AVEN_68419-1 [Araneus ventricosus]
MDPVPLWVTTQLRILRGQCLFGVSAGRCSFWGTVHSFGQLLFGRWTRLPLWSTPQLVVSSDAIASWPVHQLGSAPMDMIASLVSFSFW